MASLFDNVVDSAKVWRGAALVLWADETQSFPGKLESVIQPKTPNDPHATQYAIGSGWNVMGGTTTDGVTITREFEGQEGVEVDQLTTPLFQGDPTGWTMQVSFSLLHTDPSSLKIGWELPAIETIAANTSGPDYKVAQKKAKFSAPSLLTEYRLAVVQQHPSTEKLRCAVFRRARLLPEAKEMSMSKADASAMPMTFSCQPDTAVAQSADIFGALYEES